MSMRDSDDCASEGDTQCPNPEKHPAYPPRVFFYLEVLMPLRVAFEGDAFIVDASDHEGDFSSIQRVLMEEYPERFRNFRGIVLEKMLSGTVSSHVVLCLDPRHTFCILVISGWINHG